MTKKNNILICSAGKRVELVKSFLSAISDLKIDGEVFTTDVSPSLSAACHVSNKSFKVPKVTNKNYIEILLEICLKNKIKLVLPTIDDELEILSKNKKTFAKNKIEVVISNKNFINYCRDKRKTGFLFESIDIKYPKILSKKKLVFPCFCKPFDGSSSDGAILIFDKSELTSKIYSNKKNMFMAYINKEYKEYTIDIYFNKDGALCSLVPRERLEVRSGEVNKGVTRKNYLYHFLLNRFVSLKGVVGCITAQVFFNSNTKDVIGLEINPRFGGGYPLSDSAGAKYSEWLLREYFLNQKINFFDKWKENLLMLRYDAKVLIHEN